MSDDDRKIQLANGLPMPRLGLGFWRMRPEETPAAFKAAVQAGYRLFDTASFYGNEEALGAAWPESGLDRKDLFFTSKVWNDEQGYESTPAAAARSLERLGLDYLDLYLIHWPVAGRTEQTWRAMEEMYGQGLVRAIGVCNFDVEKLERLMSTARIKPMINQVEVHPLRTRKALRQWCAREGVAVQSFAPLARGRVFEAGPIAGLAKKYGKTPAQIVLRWQLQENLNPIPKSARESRIAENAQIWDFELTREEVAAISSLDEDRSVITAAYNFNAEGYVVV